MIFKSFIQFVREQGVAGLAVGFILGGAIAKVVTALVNDIIQPVLSLILGSAQGLATATWGIGQVQIKYGDFIFVMIDFIIVALVVYFGVTWFKLDRIDAKKEQ